MTRSVKDLRELICVSRLTKRESDEEEDDLSRPLSSLSIFGEPSAARSTSEVTEDMNGLSIAPRPPSEKVTKPRSHQSAGARRKHPAANKHISINNNASVDFKKFKVPLPPLESTPSSGSSVDSDRPGSGEVGGQDSHHSSFDYICPYIDSDVIVDWLGRANAMVSDLSSWCNSGDNFVMFANFMLTDFPEIQRLELIKMEVGILHDELGLVFDQGLKQGTVKLTDLSTLVLAILREYPGRLCSARGTYVFLDILDTLSSERTDEYKTLLTDVKISTRNRDFAQSMLAIRAFLLLSVWSNIVNFYRRFRSNDVLGGPSSSSIPTKPKPPMSTVQQRVYQAVQHGFVSVLHYLVRSRKLDLGRMDKEDRSLVFEAVMHNQPKVLHYLLNKVSPVFGATVEAKRTTVLKCQLINLNSWLFLLGTFPSQSNFNTVWETNGTFVGLGQNKGDQVPYRVVVPEAQPDLDVNHPAYSGNTPLHAAASWGYPEVVHMLLDKGQALVNATNPKCDDATPLHLAVLQGHMAICKLLLEAGADPTASMNGITPAQLAEDMGHGDILVLLSRREMYDYEEAVEEEEDALMES